MAIRIDASGDYLRRTANLPTTSAFTACCWFYYVATRSAYAYFLGLENATSSASAYLLLGFNNSNGFEVSADSGNISFGSNPATSAWHFVAIRANGTNVKGFHRTLAGTWQTATTSGAPSFTPAMLALGNDSYDEWVNCRLAGIKVWDAALSDAEIENEAETLRPQRFANLNLWTPGFSGSGERTRDYSGNGRNLTEGGTLTDEDAPPIAYGARSLWFPFVAAGGSTQFATFSASATGSPSFVKVPTKIFSSSGTGVASFLKTPTKLFASLTATGAPSFVKSPAKIISSLTATGAASFVKVPTKVFTTSSTGAASFVKTPMRIFAVTASGAATFLKSPQKVITPLTATGTAFFVKVPLKIISTLTASGTATFTTLKVRLVEFALVTATGTASFIKSPQKVIALTATGAPSFVKVPTKIISLTATGAASFVKSVSKVFSTAANGAATFTTQTFGSSVTAIRHFTLRVRSTAFTLAERLRDD